MSPDGPKCGQEGFFPTDPDLVDILGDTDFDFENFIFWIFWGPKFPDFQVPDFQISRNLALARLGLDLGLAWAQLGPGLGSGLGLGLGPGLGPGLGRAWARAWAVPGAGPGAGVGPFQKTGEAPYENQINAFLCWQDLQSLYIRTLAVCSRKHFRISDDPA